MSARTDQDALPLSLAERKELLILACAADRAAWCRACRPRPQPPLQTAGRFLRLLEPVTAMLPGRIGRWLHRATLLSRLSRQFQWLTG